MFKGYRVHHIGIVTNSINATSDFYSKIGYKISDIVEDPLQGVYICLLTVNNGLMIELVQPLSERSSVNKLLKRGGVQPYHLCYEVDDIDVEFQKLTEQENFIPLFRPVEAIAMGNKRICYLYRIDIGFLELIN